MPYKFRVESAVRAVTGAIKDAEKALARGDCTEAIDSITHAYETRGRINGFTQALRQAKGKGGISPSDLDKRFEGMLRTKYKIKRACSIGSGSLSGTKKRRSKRR